MTTFRFTARRETCDLANSLFSADAADPGGSPDAKELRKIWGGQRNLCNLGAFILSYIKKKE
jgi:hypothetical protein